MPHIDEPLLQAYIDGFCGEARIAEVEAHLASCEKCSARFEAARGAAARAGQLLGSLEPGPVHAPPFEELEARAAGEPGDAARVVEALEAARAATATAAPARRKRSVFRGSVLAWAATIVVAFAVGWLSRGVLELDPRVAQRGPAGAMEGERFRAPAAGKVAPETFEEAAVDDRDLGTTPGDAATGGDAAVGDTATAGDAADPANTTDITAGDAAAGAAPPAAAGAPPAGAVASEELPQQQTASADSTGRGAVAAAPPVPQPAQVDPAPDAAGLRPTTGAQPSDGPAAAFVASTPAPGFIPISSADAEPWLGAPLRTIPDLALVRAELVPAGLVDDGLPGRIAVRATYRTATGEQVTLQQQYLGSGPDQDLADALASEPAELADAVRRATEAEAARREVTGVETRSLADDARTTAALLDALDLPATVRDPDGLVTYTWTDGGYLLRLSASLEADAVRGLAARVR